MYITICRLTAATALPPDIFNKFVLKPPNILPGVDSILKAKGQGKKPKTNGCFTDKRHSMLFSVFFVCFSAGPVLVSLITAFLRYIITGLFYLNFFERHPISFSRKPLQNIRHTVSVPTFLWGPHYPLGFFCGHCVLCQSCVP